MKKKFLMLLVLVSSVLAVCNAQDTTPRNDMANRSIRIGYGITGSHIDAGQMLLTNSSLGMGTCGAFTIDADLFRVSNSLSIGAHLGIGEAAKWDSSSLPCLETRTIGLHYGFDMSYRVLENAGLSSDRWDLRINATIGSYWVPLLSPQLEYGAGFSATYYPFKHFGIYGDLMWGQFLYNGKGNPYLGSGSSKIGIGISYRF